MARILSVEDDEHVQHLLGRALFQQGYEMHYAWNGQEGWEKVLAVDPDLVLLDLMLPMVNGVELLQRMRAHRAVKDVPVVVVTAYGDDAQMLKEALQALGAARFLRKPIDFQELIRCVKTVLASNPRLPARSESPSARAVRKGGVAVDPVLLTVWVDDKPVGTLHNKEYSVLSLLLGSPGPVSRQALMKGLGYRAEQDAALKQVVHRLRASLGEAHKARIRTTAEGYELLG
ncbi:response regulator transcription factor [bacterium]|nr:MAG: response regulator transcription factor [bacterium]